MSSNNSDDDSDIVELNTNQEADIKDIIHSPQILKNSKIKSPTKTTTTTTTMYKPSIRKYPKNRKIKGPYDIDMNIDDLNLPLGESYSRRQKQRRQQKRHFSYHSNNKNNTDENNNDNIVDDISSSSSSENDTISQMTRKRSSKKRNRRDSFPTSSSTSHRKHKLTLTTFGNRENVKQHDNDDIMEHENGSGNNLNNSIQDQEQHRGEDDDDNEIRMGFSPKNSLLSSPSRIGKSSITDLNSPPQKDRNKKLTSGSPFQMISPPPKKKRRTRSCARKSTQIDGTHSNPYTIESDGDDDDDNSNNSNKSNDIDSIIGIDDFVKSKNNEELSDVSIPYHYLRVGETEFREQENHRIEFSKRGAVYFWYKDHENNFTMGNFAFEPNIRDFKYHDQQSPFLLIFRVANYETEGKLNLPSLKYNCEDDAAPFIIFEADVSQKEFREKLKQIHQQFPILKELSEQIDTEDINLYIFHNDKRRPQTRNTTRRRTQRSRMIQQEQDHHLLHFNRIDLNQSDIARLEEGEFLNDNIMDFFIAWKQNKAKQKNMYLFDTQFWPLLKRDINRAAERYQSSVKLFDKDFIIVPINERNHWVCCLICHPGDLHSSPDQKRGKYWRSLFYFDSLEGYNSNIISRLRKFFQLRYKTEFEDEPDKRLFYANKFLARRAKVPQQENYCDCGVFVLHYIDLLVQHPPKSFTSPFDNPEWFQLTDISRKRERIKSLIHYLANKKENDPIDQDVVEKRVASQENKKRPRKGARRTITAGDSSDEDENENENGDEDTSSKSCRGPYDSNAPSSQEQNQRNESESHSPETTQSNTVIQKHSTDDFIPISNDPSDDDIITDNRSVTDVNMNNQSNSEVHHEHSTNNSDDKSDKNDEPNNNNTQDHDNTDNEEDESSINTCDITDLTKENSGVSEFYKGLKPLNDL